MSLHVRTAALTLVALSCTADHGAGPARPFALQAAFTTAALPAVRISEIHYDNTGTDAGEAIEISGPAGTDLTGWQLVLYNGSGGASYTTTNLTGPIPATCDTRGVVVIDYPVNGIQNGSPDGVALVDVGGRVVEFLSYEGTFTAVGGPANGLVSTDIGVSEAGAEPVGQSLQRSGTGVWSGPIPNTFGACNDEEPPPPPPPPPPPETRFSEIHYDNFGTDAGEAIEIEGPAGTDLTGWSVVLYNGDPASRTSYNTRTLTASIPALCDGRGVVVLDYPTNGIQNGSPDGFALIDALGHVVEFLSYEGSFVAAGGPADGLTSIDIGVSESPSPVGQSLRRDDEGLWSGPAANTFGFCNSSPPPPPTNTITFTGRLTTDPPLPVGFEDQLFATLLDANGAPVVTTFTWRSETPTIASIDQNGVMRALAAGTAIVRATAAEGTTATYALPTRVAVASTTAVYQGNAEFGEPADGDASDDFIVRRPQYTASYNRNRGTPNWVSYDLEATHYGPEDRCDCFTFDPALPAAFTHLTTADYTGAGAFAGYGIDRGHLARSFDRTSASLDNATTFYFTNIIPQAADLNQGPWALMENYLGDLARFQDKEVYIIAGVAGSKGTVKDEGKITIPASAWKVAVILPRDHGLANLSPQDLEVLAVIMPNDPGVRNVDWHTYTTTVDAVEAASGYDLLAELPDWIEGIVEANDRFPTASAGGPYAGVEGSAVALDARASMDPDGDGLGYAWDFGDGATGTGEQPTHVYVENGAYTATVIATDPHGAADTASAAVTVENAPPTITGLVVPAAPVLTGELVTIGVSFTDPGSADTHTINVTWGDGTTNGSLSHAYTAAGLYTVTATVRDDDGGMATRAAATYVVVYDPAAGFVTGGGWVSGVGGRAIFGFEFRYRDGAATPAGTLEFRTGDGLVLTGERTDWLVVAPGYAKLRGTGALRGKGRMGSYAYLLTVVDGATDGFRLKIWDATGTVVYDDQPREPDDSRAVTPLGGGSISVQER